jgi:AcrR family transcriptional regulator|tara:strand:+ start:82 stop:519 length:438 start_codon:yes stop_codon:yes gene_type:complete
MSTITEYFKNKKEDVTDIMEDIQESLDSMLDKITKKDDEEEAETVVEDKDTPPPVPDNEDTLKKLKDNLDKLSKTSKTTSKVYKGKDLVGNPKSMGAFGPLAAASAARSASPLFTPLNLVQKSALGDINSQIQSLRKLLQGGVNV